MGSSSGACACDVSAAPKGARTALDTHDVPVFVREVKAFRVSSLSSAAEQRRFAMTIV